jgi:hypothetical protein
MEDSKSSSTQDQAVEATTTTTAPAAQQQQTKPDAPKFEFAIDRTQRPPPQFFNSNRLRFLIPPSEEDRF